MGIEIYFIGWLVVWLGLGSIIQKIIEGVKR